MPVCTNGFSVRLLILSSLKTSRCWKINPLCSDMCRIQLSTLFVNFLFNTLSFYKLFGLNFKFIYSSCMFPRLTLSISSFCCFLHPTTLDLMIFYINICVRRSMALWFSWDGIYPTCHHRCSRRSMFYPIYLFYHHPCHQTEFTIFDIISKWKTCRTLQQK